jgi:hypothetical protein
MRLPPVSQQEHVMQSTVRPDSGHSMPTEYSDMGSVASIAAFSRSLVRREQFRSGGDVEKAIQRVAGRLKVGPGTIANLVKNRVKSVCFLIGNRIIAAAIADIENEKRQLEHEHQALVALGRHADPSALAAVEQGLAIARDGLARMRGAAQ